MTNVTEYFEITANCTFVIPQLGCTDLELETKLYLRNGNKLQRAKSGQWEIVEEMTALLRVRNLCILNDFRAETLLLWAQFFESATIQVVCLKCFQGNASEHHMWTEGQSMTFRLKSCKSCYKNLICTTSISKTTTIPDLIFGLHKHNSHHLW